MKRINLASFMILVLFVSMLTSCGQQSKYTKEFPIVLNYDNMKLISFDEANGDTLARGTYEIKDAKAEDVIQNYKKILTDDGWGILGEEATQLVLQKDIHTATITVKQNVNDVTLYLSAK